VAGLPPTTWETLKTLAEDVPDMVWEYMIANPQVGKQSNNTDVFFKKVGLT
jgi:hypothetical protein